MSTRARKSASPRDEWIAATSSVAGSAYHVPVLMAEVLDALAPAPGKTILDGTLGGGGHTGALLAAGANVIALDRDEAALAHNADRLAQNRGRLTVVQRDFAELGSVLDELGVHQVDGILLDLGVSSRQLEDAERGFSFMHDGPLDMRMDRRAPLTAADLVNGASEDELARIFVRYGEEPAARRIAAAIQRERVGAKITTTGQLAGIVERLMGRREKRHPATRIFQALRIAVNAELGSLEAALEASITHLRAGGRLAVITFHSLEDRIVKRFLRETSAAEIDQPEWPAPRPNPRLFFELLTKQGVAPGDAEIAANPRARSARLRAAERRQPRTSRA